MQPSTLCIGAVSAWTPTGLVAVLMNPVTLGLGKQALCADDFVGSLSARLVHNVGRLSGRGIVSALVRALVIDLGYCRLDFIERGRLIDLLFRDGSTTDNSMLGMRFFLILWGIAATTKLEETSTLIGTLGGLYEISMTLIGWS
jgi:hypothetical protein